MTNRRRHLRVAGAVIVVAAVLLLLSPGRVLATNDENHIAEVMAGANGNSKVQFIVIRQEGLGNLWGPQFGETHSRAMLVFFDATGRETGNFKFTHDAPGPQPVNVLIATQAFANLPGAPAPDFVIPPLVNPISGKVCFQNNPLNNAFSRKDCLSYGSFTGDTGSSIGDGPLVVFGPPAPALPIVNTVSLRRPNSDASFGSTENANFVTTATPTPRNSAGASFTIPAATQIAQGDTLFNNETFLGNGRSCGSCHIASESFRLPPSNIHARFATLSTMFDPQFVAETVPSGFDAGFDFNLNTLVLTAPVTSASPCTGELRGIITAPGGGRAKVLTRLEPTAPPATSTYLVYGGKNPSFMAGEAVSDSNACSGTVSSITAGTLGAIVGSGVNGLEDPRRMRTSLSPDFPEGRGLILENIDGFPPTPPVFRKSPHLLNLSRTAPFGFGGNIPDLQTFATGAVQQHFPRTLARNSGGSNPDFRLPTATELAAIEAFMLAQEFPSGNDPDKFNLDRFAITVAQQAGRAAFFGPVAKCSMCHGGPVLAQTTAAILDQPSGVNAVFNTGVVNQPINSAGGDDLPCEPSTVSVGPCGSRKFSVPQLFNVKNLTPLFHDGSVNTVQQAVEFYNSAAFNNSPAGVAVGGISMSAGMISNITAFLNGLDGVPPPPELSVTPGSLDFGAVLVNGSADLTFTVQNVGGPTLTGTVAVSGAFSVVSGGSFSLATGASQTVTIRFSPTSAAMFTGNVNFTSNGGNLSPSVTGTGLAATTTTLASSANPAAAGQAVTFTAAVNVVAPGSGTPTGPVTFFDGATSLGSGSLDAARQATLATSALSVGAHSITAQYAGDANFNGSTSTALSQSIKVSTTTTLASSANPAAAGQAVTFTATVNVVAPGSGTPTGPVTFFDGATSLGSGPLDAARQATLTTSALSGGVRSITAQYAGDANFNGSTSAALSQAISIFDDVPITHPFFAWIEALFTAGITGGCGTAPIQYCPEAEVTRGQMAVFLERGIHGAAFQPPEATGTMFADVPVTHPFAKWIEQLARDGITGGCAASPPEYCPEATVTRGQMTVFLLRAKHGAGFQPPDATGIFADVPVTHLFARWIEQLAREGVTGGCGTSPLVYCPEDPVTRGQMAVFLARTFNLPL